MVLQKHGREGVAEGKRVKDTWQQAFDESRGPRRCTSCSTLMACSKPSPPSASCARPFLPGWRPADARCAPASRPGGGGSATSCPENSGEGREGRKEKEEKERIRRGCIWTGRWKRAPRARKRG